MVLIKWWFTFSNCPLYLVFSFFMLSLGPKFSNKRILLFFGMYFWISLQRRELTRSHSYLTILTPPSIIHLKHIPRKAPSLWEKAVRYVTSLKSFTSVTFCDSEFIQQGNYVTPWVNFCFVWIVDNVGWWMVDGTWLIVNNFMCSLYFFIMKVCVAVYLYGYRFLICKSKPRDTLSLLI